MSTARVRNISIGFALAALLGTALILFARGGEPGAPAGRNRAVREVVLRVEGMAFYLPGDPTPNPPLRVHRGETLRVVLLNTERGLEHDVVFEGLGFAVPKVMGGPEASSSGELTVDAAVGNYGYVCSLHPMMRGPLVVEP